MVQFVSTTNYFTPVFSTLRVYALTAQNKILALITLFFSLGPLYANAVRSIHCVYTPLLMSKIATGTLWMGETRIPWSRLRVLRRRRRYSPNGCYVSQSCRFVLQSR